jgi:cation diffusion facilitator CzcD-associated flavoprotein CzcO
MATDNPKPVVMIAGAGLGGLMMGILLERMNVPYHIFERATEIKPLGTTTDTALVLYYKVTVQESSC